MKRETRLRRGAAWVPLEEMETRTLLSAVPYVFHSLKGASNAAVLRARVAGLFSGATGSTYTYTLPSGTLVAGQEPEQLASFFSTARVGNITATIDWGDGSSSAGTVVKLTGHAGDGKQFGVDGAHQYAASGTYQIVVHVTVHGAVGTVMQSIQATGAASNPPVVINPPLPWPPPPYFIGSTFQQIVGIGGAPAFQSLFGNDLAQTNSRLSNIMIDWGDGSAPTAGSLVYNVLPAFIVDGHGAQQTYTVSGLHAYAAPGTYNVTITADEPTLQLVLIPSGTTSPPPSVTAVTAHATAVVTQNSADGQTVAATPGDVLAFAEAVKSYSQFPPSQSSARIDWGDGTVTDATITAGPEAVDGGYLTNVAGSHIYATPGNYRITTTLYEAPVPSDSAYKVYSYSTALITTPVAETESLLQLTTSGGTTQLSAVVPAGELPGVTVEGGISYGIGWSPDPSIHLTLISGPDIHYSATIDWGDGSVEPATVISPNEGPIFPLSGSISAGAILPFQPPNIGISGSHAYASDGTYDVTVTITELYTPATGVPEASVATFHGQAVVPTVTDVPVQVTANGNVASVLASVPVSKLPPITFPLSASTTGVVLPGPSITYTATIDWGDGVTTIAEMQVPSQSGNVWVSSTSGGELSVILTGVHQYDASGKTYPVTVTLTASYARVGLGPVTASEVLLGEVVV